MDMLVAVSLIVLLLVGLSVVLVFAKIVRLWIQCTLSGAQISLPQIVMMTLRRTPARLICEAVIKLNLAGIAVSSYEVEGAYLQGADVEKLTKAMLHAKRTGREVSWMQLVETELVSS